MPKFLTDVELPRDPDDPGDAASKKYVDDRRYTDAEATAAVAAEDAYVKNTGDTMEGNLSMGGAWSITNAYRMIGAGDVELYDGTWASGITLAENYVTISGKKIDLLASPGPVSIISQSADLTLAGYPNVLLEGHPRSTYTPDAADSLTNKEYVDQEIENADYSPTDHDHSGTYAPEDHSHPGTDAEVYLNTVDPGVLGYDLIWADPDQVLTEAEYLTQPDADALYSPLGHTHGATAGYKATIGDGTNHTYTVVHNIGTQDVMVQMFDVATGEDVTAIMTRNPNTVVLEFAGVLSPASVRVMVKEV